MTDKALHLIGCFLISYLSPQSPEQAYYTAIGIGAAKEVVYDGMIHRGTADHRDFIADVVGAQIGYELRKKKIKAQPKMQIIGLDGKEVKPVACF